MEANGEFALAIDALRRGDLERARSLAARQVELAPSPEWQHLLGLVHCRLGKPEDGVKLLRAALVANPANVQYRVMLVRALIDCGRATEALAEARRPAPGPAAAALWQLRAEAADAAGSLADRTEAIRNAQLDATAAQLRQDPDTVPLLLRFGRLLGALGRDEEARAAYRRILDAEPANVEAVRELGLLLERANRTGELRGLLDRAAQAGCERNSFPLLEALIAWRERNPKRALDWLTKVGPDEDQASSWQLETKVQDALGNPEGAFAAAEARNRAVPDRDQWRRSAQAFRQELRASAELITPQWAARWASSVAPAARVPAFLVGFPRSGTTLLDTFLMGHPQVRVLEEIPILGLVAEKVGSIAAVADLDESCAEHLRGEYLRVLDSHGAEGFDGIVIDKLPLNMLWAPLIYRLFPNAKIVFAQRHPCDCVLSAFLQSFSLNPAMASFLDLADSADFYDCAMEIWTRGQRALSFDSRRVVYERLVDDPERELRPVTEWLGLQWADQLVDHRRTAGARGAISTPSYDQVVEPVSPGAVGRWRRYERQLEPVLPMLLPWAERLGYES